eukprot:7710235-Pyramimonas_sp.AAC.1
MPSQRRGALPTGAPVRAEEDHRAREGPELLANAPPQLGPVVVAALDEAAGAAGATQALAAHQARERE